MIDQLFTYAPSEALAEQEEAELIRLAQAGDEGAVLALMQAYGPALRSAVARFSKASHSPADVRPVEDLRSAAVVAFLEVIAEHDPALNPRLAGRVSVRLTSALADEVSATAAFRVPERTLSRFYGILRNAEGNVALAEEAAPDYGMSREVFRDVLAAVGAYSLDAVADAEGRGGAGKDKPPSAGVDRLGAAPIWSSTPIADVEDAILVDMAFAAVDDEEARICELAYGFTDYDPVPDAEIGHRLGLTRPTVQRKRGKALSKMRKALGVTHA